MEASAADNLLRLIKQLLLERAFDGIKMLFYSPTEVAKNAPHMPAIAMDLYSDICAPTLTDATNVDDGPLFDCCNELLKIVAQYAPLQQFMLELMEKIEESSSIAIFSAYLRALQVVLLRQGNTKPQATEWCLSSVVTRLRALPLPDYVNTGYDAQQALLLEQEQQIEQLMAHYITVDLCCEPLLQEILQQEPHAPVFRDCNLNRRNVFTCFLLQLMDKPLALLELSNVTKSLLDPGASHTCSPSAWRLRPELTQRNFLQARATAGQAQTYVQQVVQTLTKSVNQLIGDPYYLLGLVESRARWKRRLDPAKGVFELTNQNMFLIDEKLPLTAVGMYYHALLVGQLMPPNAPKIYAPLFLFEASLYLVAVLLEQTQPPLQHCGLRLSDYVLSIIREPVPQCSLDLEVHKRYCDALCKITGYAPQESLRRLGLQVLHHYILSFEDAAKYFILKNLLETLKHDGIHGYLAGLYKDIVAEHLARKDKPLPDEYCGIKFRSLLLQCVCVLPQDVKSDLLLHTDSIVGALNVLRYFAAADRTNRTGFWDIMPEIQKLLLEPLGTALNFSLAHYRAYRERVKNGQSASDDELMQKQLNMLAVNISNSGMDDGDGNGNGDGDGVNADGENLPSIGREEKLEVLASSITGLESMRVIYLLASDCIEQSINQHAQSCLLDTTCNAGATASIHTLQQQQCTTLKPTASLRRNYAKDTDKLDDFRAREEQRERERDAAEAAAGKSTQSVAGGAGDGQQHQSEEEAAKQAKVDGIRNRILDAAMLHVPQHGWTKQAIVQGAEECGYPSVVHGMFPEGGFALVSHFNGKCNAQLVQSLQQQTDNGQKEVSDPLDFLVQAVRQRLAMIEPYKTQWPQAMALIAQPQHASTALAQVLTLVDDICYYSGDRSVDFGWYTRRVGLATIMKMTELYMLQDKSADHARTWEFLKNRMDEAVQLQMALSQTEGMTQTFSRSFNSAFITARNILGLGYSRH